MTEQRISLNELAEGQAVEAVFLLAKKQLMTTKAGKPYGSLRLADASGEVEAKLWDQAEELLAPLCAGQAVRVSGRVQAYQGQIQMVLSAVALEPKVDATKFLPRSPVDLGELWGRLGALKQAVQNKHLQRLLRAFFDEQDFRHDFERAPAAKAAHHAYLHGLLEHTVSVGEAALAMAAHYPHLERDLLLCGALLHDVGKVEELTIGPPLDYTDAGRLEGHVVLGVRLLDGRLARSKGFPAGLASHLRHLIVSHHGVEEFGSPQKPKLAEAMALHLLDDLDAKLFMFRAAREANGEGNWSSFNRLLERHLYTGPTPWDDAPAGSNEACSQKKLGFDAPTLF
ncbi:MAG: HD domain-containing protein [Pseudomonadota bacterium]